MSSGHRSGTAKKYRSDSAGGWDQLKDTQLGVVPMLRQLDAHERNWQKKRQQRKSGGNRTASCAA